MLSPADSSDYDRLFPIQTTYLWRRRQRAPETLLPGKAGPLAGPWRPPNISRIVVARLSRRAATVKTRQRKTPQQIVLNRPDGPCPCGSGKPVRLCCLQADGSLRIRPPDLHPPGNITGFAKERCYLSTTGNCSHTSSGEHYISKSLLTEIGNTVSAGGFPWSGPTPETQKIVGINSLTANILCKRHNTALSELDKHAGKFMRVLKAISHDLDNNAPHIPHDLNYLLSGEIVECWMLKVLLGMFFFEKRRRPRRTGN